MNMLYLYILHRDTMRIVRNLSFLLLPMPRSHASATFPNASSQVKGVGSHHGVGPLVQGLADASADGWGGFQLVMGGTPIAGWFISWKPP